jgi:hypothetical protein
MLKKIVGGLSTEAPLLFFHPLREECNQILECQPPKELPPICLEVNTMT